VAGDFIVGKSGRIVGGRVDLGADRCQPFGLFLVSLLQKV
jgi:hypothetical protein